MFESCALFCAITSLWLLSSSWLINNITNISHADPVHLRILNKKAIFESPLSFPFHSFLMSASCYLKQPWSINSIKEAEIQQSPIENANENLQMDHQNYQAFMSLHRVIEKLVGACGPATTLPCSWNRFYNRRVFRREIF